MSMMNNHMNYYADLRGYRLEGTRYRWAFTINPTANNHFAIKVSLKPTGWFQKALMTTEVTVDNDDDTVSILKSSMDKLLHTEFAQRIFSAEEMSSQQKTA